MGRPARLALSIAIFSGIASAALAQQRDAGIDAGPPDSGALDTGSEVTGQDASVTAPSPGDGPILPPGVGPITWDVGPGRDCHRYSKRRVCEGPRRVPLASLEALERQRALGLDQARIAHAATTAPARPEWIAAIPGEAPTDMLWPVQGGRLWRGFGLHKRIGRTKSGRIRHLRARRRHEGVDIGAHDGTPIVATNDALVLYSDNGMSGYGNALILAHRDGSTTLYAHCRATYVAAGELVRRGQIIAAVGDTGLAHGAHLHFEWRVEGRTRDPIHQFVGRPVAHESAPDAPDDPAP